MNQKPRNNKHTFKPQHHNNSYKPVTIQNGTGRVLNVSNSAYEEKEIKTARKSNSQLAYYLKKNPNTTINHSINIENKRITPVNT